MSIKRFPYVFDVRCNDTRVCLTSRASNDYKYKALYKYKASYKSEICTCKKISTCLPLPLPVGQRQSKGLLSFARAKPKTLFENRGILERAERHAQKKLGLRCRCEQTLIHCKKQ